MLKHHLQMRPCLLWVATLTVVLAGCALPGPRDGADTTSGRSAAPSDTDADLPPLTRKPSSGPAAAGTALAGSGAGASAAGLPLTGGRRMQSPDAEARGDLWPGPVRSTPALVPPTAARIGTAAGSLAGVGPDVSSSGAVLPSGWEPWILHPTKAKTQYRLERIEGSSGYVMRADADSSASGLATEFRMEPSRRPYIEWRWRIEGLIPGADNTDRYADDSPVRVVLAFDGDKSQLSLRDRMFFERARLFTGRDMPYATLMYIWENNKPVGTVIENPHTGRVRKIVVASGPAGVQEWKTFRRNIVEDYKLAYGKLPGKLVGVAILTDTDNTKEKVTAWYGDIKLLRR